MNILAPPDILKWLILDLNSFFASCEEQDRPELRGRPVAVVPLLADTTCAIAASYAAKAFGIKTGTPVWEAKKLCRDLRIVEARPKRYVEYHHEILKAIETCLPIDKVLSIDEVACRLDNKQREPVEAQILARNIKSAIRQQVGAHLTSSIGVAANKLLAKLASDMQKPDGLIILTANDLPHTILNLKLEDIPGIGRNMAERLRHAGIGDIETLWRADAQWLRRIWNGVTGLRFHSLLHGADIETPPSPKRSIGHQHVMAPVERSMERATPVIRQLLIRAAQRLRVEGIYCRRLVLDIKWDYQAGYYFKECSFHETQDTAFLLDILMPLWNAAPRGRPLRVGVMLLSLVAQTEHQFDLFHRPKPVQLTGAIDKLNTKFGRGTVNYGSAIPEMVSKIAFQRVPKVSEF